MTALKMQARFEVALPWESVAAAAHELAALDAMSVGEFADKYRDVLGEPTHSRNKEFLRKRIAERVQERAEGGFSPRALERVEQPAPNTPVRWRQPALQKSDSRPAPLVTAPARDRLRPDIGAVITRVHDGKKHQVWGVRPHRNLLEWLPLLLPPRSCRGRLGYGDHLMTGTKVFVGAFYRVQRGIADAEDIAGLDGIVGPEAIVGPEGIVGPVGNVGAMGIVAAMGPPATAATPRRSRAVAPPARSPNHISGHSVGRG